MAIMKGAEADCAVEMPGASAAGSSPAVAAEGNMLCKLLDLLFPSSDWPAVQHVRLALNPWRPTSGLMRKA